MRTQIKPWNGWLVKPATTVGLIFSAVTAFASIDLGGGPSDAPPSSTNDTHLNLEAQLGSITANAAPASGPNTNKMNALNGEIVARMAVATNHGTAMAGTNGQATSQFPARMRWGSGADLSARGESNYFTSLEGFNKNFDLKQGLGSPLFKGTNQPKMGIDPNDPLLNEGDVTVWAIDPTKVSKINVIDY